MGGRRVPRGQRRASRGGDRADARGRAVRKSAMARQRGYAARALLQQPAREVPVSRMDRSRAESLSLRVALSTQTLTLERSGMTLKTYAVSTSKHGAGETGGSFKTPRGRHVIRAKIGAGAP